MMLDLEGEFFWKNELKIAHKYIFGEFFNLLFFIIVINEFIITVIFFYAIAFPNQYK